MALRHKAFLFDENTFKRAISTLIEAVDEGNLWPLYAEANNTIRNAAQDTWQLDEVGSSLLGPGEIDAVDFAGVPRKQPIRDYLEKPSSVHPGEIGYWLLIVMSRYLEKSDGIGADYPILETALGSIGWIDKDRERLFRGLPCCLLVRQNCERALFRTDNDPYWHWIVPSHAQSSGWLPHDEVVRLLDRLVSAQVAIRNYGLRRFPNPWNLTEGALSDSQQDYFKRLQKAYDRAKATFEHARQSSKGVFMAMAY